MRGHGAWLWHASASMPEAASPSLIHLVGYLTGASLYGMLLVMALATRGPARRPIFWTGLLGLGWNGGELATHLADGAGWPLTATWVGALSYVALGLLAAVAVHAAARGSSTDPLPATRQVHRPIAMGAYLAAAVAGALQIRAAIAGGPVPSPLGLQFLTAGIGVLAVVLLVVTRRQPNSRRALWIASLALVAVSALHLGQGHGRPEGWLTELAGHQAAIPLALAVLYQDYRFGFVDLFLKRALTLLALVGLALGGWSLATLLPEPGIGSPAFAGVLVGFWVGTALIYPRLRTGIDSFVDRALLRRVDYDALTDQVARAVQSAATEDDVLRTVGTAISDALDASLVTWDPAVPLSGGLDVPVPTTDAPQQVLRVGPLAPGRRLLSEERAMLDRLAALAGRRIDVIRLGEERFAHASREREARAAATESELRALRAQINPHFLFNALTTIGHLIQHAPERAVDTLMQLTTLLRAVLKSDGAFTTLGHECHIVQCYLDIERTRFEERLDATVDVPPTLAGAEIPTLVVQPLVENAIKHGIAPARGGGTVRLTAAATDDGRGLRVSVRNTGMPLGPQASGGIGLENVRQRLRHSYGERGTLVVRTEADGATLAELTLPLTLRPAMRPRLERAS